MWHPGLQTVQSVGEEQSAHLKPEKPSEHVELVRFETETLDTINNKLTAFTTEGTSRI